MKTNEKYLKNNIIAYIGNKRNLLSLIEKAIKRTKLAKVKRDYTFVDLFAGSGVVSRLAKSLGFKVIANDWEYYSPGRDPLPVYLRFCFRGERLSACAGRLRR